MQKKPFIRLFAGLFVALLFLVVSPLHALDWDRTEVALHAGVGEEIAPTTFTFTNNTKATVTITEVRVSCGCLTIELGEKRYAPGESGTLTVHFDRTGLTGKVERSVAVMTDEARKEPYLLVLRADLPEALVLAPRLVYWVRGDAPVAKAIDIQVRQPGGVEITGALCNSGDFKVELVELEARRHYRLDITPEGTTTARLAVIALQTSQALPPGTVLTVYAQVR